MENGDKNPGRPVLSRIGVAFVNAADTALTESINRVEQATSSLTPHGGLAGPAIAGRREDLRLRREARQRNNLGL
jgi:hypothetical protein